MKFRAITYFGDLPGYSCNGVYFKIEKATSEQMQRHSVQLASPKFKFDSEEEVIKSLNGSRKPLVLLSGKIVIPDEINYPNLWKERIFIRWNPGIKELWPGDEGYDKEGENK